MVLRQDGECNPESRRVLPGIQDYYNRKGLISERGQRKLAFSVLREWYEELAK